MILGATAGLPSSAKNGTETLLGKPAVAPCFENRNREVVSGLFLSKGTELIAASRNPLFEAFPCEFGRARENDLSFPRLVAASVPCSLGNRSARNR